MKQILEGIRILDLTRVLAGPWCAQNLADLGADVIKVERPGAGDDTRTWGPPFLKDRAGHDTTDAAYYLAANRGKKSVTIDLACAAGQQAVRELALQCDVLLENYKVGQLKKYGLDYDSLRTANPRLIYCSITGFGQTGPWAHRPGYDFLIQGVGGLMSVTGEADDRPGGGPQKVGVAVADLFAGMYTTVAILAALRHRDATGLGQVIDMALLDTQVAMLANLGANYLVTKKAPRRAGNAHPNIVPYQVFEVADGHLILAIGNDGQFQRFCAVAGCAEVAGDTRFARNADRVRHRDALVPMLVPVLLTRTRAQWLSTLEAATVPCGPINDFDDVFADPQVKARGMVARVPHPHSDALDLVASPLKLSRTPVRSATAPPLLGEHTDEVLAGFGFDATERQRLRDAGVFGASAVKK